MGSDDDSTFYVENVFDNEVTAEDTDYTAVTSMKDTER